MAILEIRPNVPMRQSFSWRTNILRSYDGTEHRVSTRARPRQRLAYDIVPTSDDEVRLLQRLLFTDIETTIDLPIWSEPFVLTADAAAAATTLNGDFAQLDLEAGGRIYLFNRATGTGEAATLTARTDTSVSLSAGIANAYPAASTLIYPLFAVQIPDGTSLSRGLVNVGSITIEGIATTLQDLIGRGATVPTFNSRPLLDRTPIRGPFGERTTIDYDVVDFGTVREIFAGQARPDVSGERVFRIGSRDELQFWKAFLDDVQGRRGAFYFPSGRDDLVAAVQPTPGSTTLTVQGEELYGATWFPAVAWRSVMVTNNAGTRTPYRVIGVGGNPDGTQRLILSPALPADPDAATVAKIEFLYLARLGSDLVELRHLGVRSEITLSFETESTP